MSSLLISLDFELFWGVADSRTIKDYGKNIEGARKAIPRLLKLFRQYDIRCTWATVGMLMCRDYAHWKKIQPAILPSYNRSSCSSFALGSLPQEYPELFFARPLVEQILDTAGQELASHTYSHFYCDEPGATAEQFAADLACAQQIGAELGTRFKSLVFPRNQVKVEYLGKLRAAGFKVYRGNPQHWLYRGGHVAPGGTAGRLVRAADAWFPLTGMHVSTPEMTAGLVNLPASQFLRPWSRTLSPFEPLRLARLKNAMTHAAKTNGIFHLWWHPHNFGANTDQNIASLKILLEHFEKLNDKYGMTAKCMGDFADADGQNIGLISRNSEVECFTN
jgi:peptidoglycan/xylan/chitin deacetylase (PgdA/CDA1 family)